MKKLPPSAGSQQWVPWYDPVAKYDAAANPNPPTSIAIPPTLCPSDGSGAMINKQDWGWFSFGNYHVMFGGLNLGEATGIATGSPPELAPKRAAFGVNFGASLGEISDGTSNTVIMTEYLRSTGVSNDQRGLHWGDQPGYGHVYTQLPPNASGPDFLYTGWCNDQPKQNLPCISGDDGPNNHVAARSRHSGGVQALLGDGSVRFVRNSVDLLNTWRPMATIAGGEVNVEN